MKEKRITLFFITLFALGVLAVLSSHSALADRDVAGTYSCRWTGAYCEVDPAKTSCNSGFGPGNTCTFRNKAECLGAAGSTFACIEAEAKTGTAPKTPTAKTGVAGCKWEKVGKYKCSPNPQCVSPYTQPSWLNCEEIKKGDKWKTEEEAKRECESFDPERKRAACELAGSITSPGDIVSPGGEVSIKNPLKAGTIPDILNAIAGFLYYLALAVVTVMVLWAGFQILTAAGSPEGIDRGKRTLLWAIVGTVVILIAGGIADIVADILGGGGGSQEVPSRTETNPLPGTSTPE